MAPAKHELVMSVLSRMMENEEFTRPECVGKTSMGHYMLPTDQTFSPGLLAVENSSKELRTPKQITTRFCQATHGGGLVMPAPRTMA